MQFDFFFLFFFSSRFPSFSFFVCSFFVFVFLTGFIGWN